MSHWRTKYLSGGLEGVLVRGTSPGRTPQVQGEALVRLKARLSDSEGFGSYQQIGRWVKEELDITLKPKTLYHLCHYKLGATAKVARPRNPKQDEQAVAALKETSTSTFRWPSPRSRPTPR